MTDLRDCFASFDRYVSEGIPCGSFLTAVLENDLRESLGRADWQNREQLFQIVSYLYDNVPAVCWGSPEKVKAWLNRDAEERRAIAKAFDARHNS